jgi:transposase
MRRNASPNFTAAVSASPLVLLTRFFGVRLLRITGKSSCDVDVETLLRIMIPVPSGVRVWLATGHTDMRNGFASLSLQVQEVLRRDPLSGQLFCFRGRRGNLLKVIWHDGQGACLFTKRLERGRFLWPSAADGAVTISSAQLSYLLSGIDWRNPQETWRPTSVG